MLQKEYNILKTMKNIELKIKIDKISALERSLIRIGAKRVGVLIQIDIYYYSKSGRLKMREINNKEFQLIHYLRPDSSTHKISQYQIVEFDKISGKTMENILQDVLGVMVVVKKKRILWMYGNTRIHLDKVEGLGEFLELESVVKDGVAAARKEYDYLMKVLNLNSYPKEKKSYSDLLLKK